MRQNYISKESYWDHKHIYYQKQHEFNSRNSSALLVVRVHFLDTAYFCWSIQMHKSEDPRLIITKTFCSF